jgi:RNA polymerase sigma factor for flagellar operon FliA
LDDAAIKQAWLDYTETRDQDIKDEITVHYLPLVKQTACRLAMHLPSHVQTDDLISAGVFGLLSSVEKFDPHTGNQFKSFAMLRIQGAMLDELRHMDWVPRTIRSKAKKLQEAYNAVQQKMGRFATDHEVAEYLGITIEELNHLIETTKSVHMISLDSKIRSGSYDSEGRFQDIIPDQRATMPYQELSRQEYKDILTQAIMDLGRKEIIVLTLYYFEDLTLKEIGLVLGVTESRVSQIHSKALYRLKSRLNLSEVADYAPH